MSLWTCPEHGLYGGDVFCPKCGGTGEYATFEHALEAEQPFTFIQCGGPCEHEFSGWREFDDGNGGEQFCQKCGLGAMAWSMWHA